MSLLFAAAAVASKYMCMVDVGIGTCFEYDFVLLFPLLILSGSQTLTFAFKWPSVQVYGSKPLLKS